MRIVGILMVITGAIINLCLAVQSGASLLMDSDLKIFLTIISTHPILYVISVVLFFGGFALAVFGSQMSESLRVKRNMKRVVKNARNYR